MFSCNYVQTHTANLHVGVKAHKNSKRHQHSAGSAQSILFSNSPPIRNLIRLIFTNGLTLVTKCCFHYEKTLKNCGRRRVEDIARKHTTNQRKNSYTYRHSLYSSNIVRNDGHLFRSLQHFLAAKMLNDVEEVKNCLTPYFVVIFYYSSMQIHKKRKKDIQ